MTHRTVSPVALKIDDREVCNVGEEKVVEVLLEGTSVEIAQVDDELVEVEDTFELCQPCVASSPYAPSRQERAEHNVTHCPFRSWCKHCVAGQAKNSPHYVDKSKDPESRVPIVSVDYALCRTEEVWNKNMQKPRSW